MTTESNQLKFNNKKKETNEYCFLMIHLEMAIRNSIFVTDKSLVVGQALDFINKCKTGEYNFNRDAVSNIESKVNQLMAAMV